jgi:hypothetical protein
LADASQPVALRKFYAKFIRMGVSRSMLSSQDATGGHYGEATRDERGRVDGFEKAG